MLTYQSKRQPATEVEQALQAIARRHPGWGFCRAAGAVLNAYLFRNLAQVREVVETWLKIYNTERPHQALGFMTPIEFKQAG